MISDATTKKATDQAVLSADWVGIERLFTGKFRQFISHAQRHAAVRLRNTQTTRSWF